MQSIYDIRRDNLRLLMRQWGGPTSLARKLGHSNGSYLAQLAGPKPTREVSEKVAWEFEEKLGLPRGWMDEPHADTPRVDEAALAETVRAAASALRDAGLRPDPDRYATLVSLAFEHYRLIGKLEESHIRKLVSLLKEK